MDDGQALRSARESAGVSLSALASEMHYTKGYVSLLERGQRTLTPELAIEYREALARIEIDQGGDDDVKRREFVGYTVTASVSLGLPEHRSVDSSLLAELRTRTQRFRRMDRYMGGNDTFPLYLSEFERTAGLAKTLPSTERLGMRLLAIVAEQAQQAGWAAFDGGKLNEARHLFDASRSIAVEAKDSALHGNALAFLSYMESEPTQRVYLAEESRRIGRSVPHPSVRALLFERLAWAYATTGQAREADWAMDDARRALAEPVTEEPPDWAAWVDETELDIMQGRCGSVLGRSESVTTLETALSRYDDAEARDKALYLSWLADAQLDTGEVEQAAETTVRIAELSAGVASVRPAERLSRLVGRLTPHNESTAVATALDVARSVTDRL